jgi:nuclear pore complex protein Nup93
MGAIDKFTSEGEANLIISLVAEEMENKGLIEEAIKLYDLSRNYQRVLELSNKLISQVVTEVNVANSNRDRLKNMVMTIALRYKTETTSNTKAAVPKSIMNTFFLLTDLLTFFDFYHAENWDVAYETLCKLQVLPQVSQSVELKVKDFIAYSEEIKRNFPDIILAAMTIISNLYDRISRFDFLFCSLNKAEALLVLNNSNFSKIIEQRTLVSEFRWRLVERKRRASNCN